MSTYSPQDAVNLVQSYAHGIPVSSVQSNVCDIVQSMMWVFYPWSWTVGSFTAIPMTQGVQDYTPNSADITAMLRPLIIRLRRTDISPNEVRELALLANLGVELSRTAGLETIKNCGWLASSSTIRLEFAASIGTGQAMQIEGFYQKKPPRITDQNMSTPFSFPDHYFNVFVEGLKWKLYQLADDPRSGTMQYSKNGSQTRQYTGQLGIFMDAILAAARTEDLSAGDEFMYPESGLGVGRSYFPGLYGI